VDAYVHRDGNRQPGGDAGADCDVYGDGELGIRPHEFVIAFRIGAGVDARTTAGQETGGTRRIRRLIG